ncbi:unnamed protein product [Darwinula stevensoni]|uniref:RING-type E3 ubiquitin transferase n=1 Tax=Darwinula stevensoni TaxID=69355 RepID=A0A7R9A5X7_9CRUS|nr:unnamed protein product [Darwinula stevensoni]CAG0886262.1 unnamed protein product [Darwinula stevensoni]
MSGYFEEHNCTPLPGGSAPNHALHFARLLLHTGSWEDLELEWSQLFGEPCPICLKPYSDDEDEVGATLPCKHTFHKSCVTLWLNKTNSCPLCRHELPTDDADYEEYKRQKARSKQRAEDVEALHNSMFS